jgi:hypothetical protein
MKAEEFFADDLCKKLKEYPELAKIGLARLGYAKRDDIIEECALLATKQKELCGCSMTRKSTCDDIAFNLRRLKCTTVSAMTTLG